MKQGMIVVMFLVLWVGTKTNEVSQRCPGPSEWNRRATVNCNSDKHYVCLYNEIDHVYLESCIPEEYLARIGKKKVRSPGLNEDDCSPDRYQPFIFTTRGNSDCVFVKSFCNEEGQVPANNGNTTTDRGCRCDYTKGYTYATTPRDVCSCIPSEEDCHCYLKPCPVGHKLTADYTCTDHLVLQTCPEIRKSTVTVTQKSPNVNDTDNISETVTYARNAANAVLIITVIYIVLLLMLFINVQPYIVTVKYQDSLIVEICDEPFTYTVMPGDVLTIEWKVKSLFPIKSAVCEKNGKEIKSVVYEMKWKEIKSLACENDQGRTKLGDDKYTMNWSDDLMVLSLTINKFEVEDAGMYTCKVTNVVHLTNTCADSFLNVPPCKRITVGVRKCMQYFPMIRLDVKNQVKLCVGNIPTSILNRVVIKDNMAKLEVPSMKNVTSVKWFRCHNKHFTSISDANKYNGGSTTTPSLSINTTKMDDAGIYVCLIKNGENDNSAFRYKLKVIPEGEMLT